MPEPVSSAVGLGWATTAFTTAQQARYERFYKYLRGDHPLEFATPKFRSAFGRAFDAFSYNRMPMVVDAISDRMQITGFGSTPDTLAKQWEKIWDANRMDVRAGQVEREQLAAGIAYVIVELDPESGDVLLWPQPAHAVRVHYADDRPGHIDYAVKRWRDSAGYDRLSIYYEDRLEKYRARAPRATGAAASTATAFTTVWERHQPDSDQTWPLMLPVPDTVPVFPFPNNAGIDGEGVSELADVIAIQDALNKSLMDLLVAMEFAAFPQRVIVNVDTADKDTATALEQFQVGIDRLLKLVGTEEAPVSFGEFAAANIQQYTDVINLFDTLISRESKVPVHYLQMTGDFGSGEARRLAEIPFVAKVDDRIRAATPVWSDVARYGLRASGTECPPGAIKVNWAPTAALSEEEAVRLAAEKLRVGFSERAAMREMGREETEIDKLFEERAEEAESRVRAFNMGDLAGAVNGGV